MEYHKGQPCVHKPILCQEGYCSECGVYYQSLVFNESEYKNADVKDREKVRDEEFVVLSTT